MTFNNNLTTTIHFNSHLEKEFFKPNNGYGEHDIIIIDQDGD